MNVQVARPVRQLSNSGFSPSDVTPRVNGVSPDDGNPASGALGAKFEVKLDALQWPDAGDQVVSVRLKTDANDPLVTLELVQGTQVVASRSVQPAAQYAVPPFTLTAGEKAAISNYQDLHLRVTVGISVACCPDNGVPSALHATFSNGTGGCACLDGLTVGLAWDGTSWAGPFTACGGALTTLNVGCQASTGQFGVTSSAGGSSCALQPAIPSSTSCAPFALTFAGLHVSGCCSGTIDLTVTP